MEIVHDHLHEFDPLLPQIAVNVDRMTLAKRRWRGTASDGKEFGFDLEHHLHDEDVFFQSETGVYRIAQTPESVLAIDLATDAPTAARLGWIIGNLHFQLGIVASTILVPDDSALRQLFEREQIAFTPATQVFHPLSGGHHH